MTTRLLLAIVLLQTEWQPGEAWCFYFCPKQKSPETFCAVDSTRGAKLFQGRCQIWRANYCLTADYRVMDMQQCLDRYPGVLVDYLSTTKSLRRFDSSKVPPSVGMWRRFFLLWSILSRMAPRAYAAPPTTAILLTLIQLMLNQRNIRPSNDPFSQSTFSEDLSYPGSSRINPLAFSGSSRFNPFAFPGSPFFDPFSDPESPLS